MSLAGRSQPQCLAQVGWEIVGGGYAGTVGGEPNGREGLVVSNIDLKEIARGKFDLDVAGHYARPDIFSLTVDLASKPAVFAEDADKRGSVSIPSLLGTSS